MSKSRKKRKKSEVDRDFEEGEAAPDAAELAILQSQMLEVSWFGFSSGQDAVIHVVVTSLDRRHAEAVG